MGNAGLAMWSSFLDVEETTWDSVVDLNLKGTYFGVQAAARQMVGQGQTTITSGKLYNGVVA